MKCLNCGTKYEGNYCPECGQSAGTKRFQAIEMFTSVVTSIIGGDNKLLTTCYDLLRRPGYMVREYLLGKRVTYYAPVPLLICLVAIYALASYIITDAVSPFDLIKFNLEEDDVTTGSARTFIQYYAAIIDNKVYFALISVVLNLLPYRYVFRKCKIERPDGTMQQLNLPEHFFSIVYQTCFNMLLSFILLPFSLIEGSEVWTTKLCFVAPTIYCIILYKQICGISYLKSICLNIIATVIAIIASFLLLLFIFGILYGYDYAIT